MKKEPVRFRFSAFADEIDPSFDAQLHALKKLGISLLELRGVDGKSFTQLTDGEVSAVRQKLNESNIGLSALGSPIGKIPVDGDFEAHLKLLDRVMDIGEALDCFRIRMFSFYPAKGMPEEEFENAAFERIAALLDRAEARGFQLCHENEKDLYGESPQKEKKMLAVFGGRLKAVLDPGNFAYCLLDARPSYALLKDYVLYMHLKDADETGAIVVPGEGKACLREILADVGSDEMRRGTEMILTVEPHLMDFVGLSSLSAPETELKRTRSFRTPEEAFETAVNALRPMVESAGVLVP